MPEPTKIPRPFADSGDKNSIPDSSGSIGFASWQEGFPAITSEPFASGGVAPKRADFNGIFNALSAATVWTQQGGVYAYDATTDYEVGNIVEYSGDLYKCLTANGPSSAVKDPTDTTVWDAIATASGYLPLSGGVISNSVDSLSLRPGLIEISSNVPFIDFHHGNSLLDFTARIINDTSGRLLITVKDDANTQIKNLSLSSSGTLTWDGKDVATIQSGTWTPTLVGSNTNGTITYTERFGRYEKIGNTCFIWGRLQFSISTVPTGYVYVNGLPYASLSSSTGPNGNITAIGNNSFRRIFGGQVNGTTLRLFAVNADTPYYKDLASWGASSSDVGGYKVYNNSVFFSGAYLTA